MPQGDLGKFLVVIGGLIVLVGALLWSGIGKSWLAGSLAIFTTQKGISLSIFQSSRASS
jgi:hypothetical protein